MPHCDESSSDDPKLDLSIFDGVVSNFKNYIEAKEKKKESLTKEDNSAFFSMALDTRTIQEFFLYSLKPAPKRDRFLYWAWSVNRQLPSSPRDMILIKRFHQAGHSFPSLPDTHALEETEYQNAKHYLQDNPKLLATFMLIQEGFTHYLSTLREVLKKKNLSPTVPTWQGTYEDPISSLIGASTLQKSIVEEFLPLFALVAKQQKGEFDAAQVTNLGLKLSFDRRAFDSFNAEHSPQTRTCPLKKIIYSVMNTGFVTNASGEIEIAEEPISGGLISAIHERIPEPLAGYTPDPTFKRTIKNLAQKIGLC